MSKIKLTYWAAICLTAGMLAACNVNVTSNHEFGDTAKVSTENRELKFEVIPSTLSEDWYPCSMCHSPEDEVNTTPHDVEFHEDVHLNHGPDRWCLDCHVKGDRDKLHLVNGTPIEFEQAYRLCGQCHESKLKDWKAGEHGKLSGGWKGDRKQMMCTSCHNPHSPHFRPLTPLPPPNKQKGNK